MKHTKYSHIAKWICFLFIVVMNISTGSMAQTPVVNSIQKSVDKVDTASTYSVYYPVFISPKTTIFNWALGSYETSYDGTRFAFYKLYLNSLDVKNYSLLIPTDESLNNYIDPIAYGQDVQGILKFWYDSNNTRVSATILKYNKATGVTSDSVGVISGNQDVSVSNLVRNRLLDLLDSHIVVGDIEAGDQYFVTKGNDIVKVNGAGASLNVQGGGDILNNKQSNVSQIFSQANGKTYFLDKPIQPALKSVYRTLYETPEFSEFFNLLSGAPADSILVNAGTADSDWRVKFFNAYNYTVYVPTNTAVQKALADKIILSWTDINNLNASDKAAATHKLIRFLKYHLQVNAIFVGNKTVEGVYKTATLKTDNVTTGLGTSKNKFLKLRVSGTGGDLTITTETGKIAHILKSDPVTGRPLYNLISKEYIFAKNPIAYNNIASTGAVVLPLFSTSTIMTSSSAVIHQIDNVLTFE